MAAPPKTWLVDGSAKFNANSEQVLNLAHENCPIAAVSIIGVQSTGKSTLLNKCFSTNFPEMDESQGLRQTTKGIWIAKGPSLNDGTKILLIDTEGSDGSEREREGDDSFERKSATFALAMSNTVIVNMRCENIGLHNGASWPLLKTVFQVMVGKFTGTPRKVNLMFVLRDKNKSPLNILETQLRKRLDEMWKGISSSEATLESYFKVEVMTMSNYATQKEEFDKDVECVRKRLLSLVKDGQTCGALAFLDLAKTNWDDIMKNKILNLNLNKITVDKVFCHDIMEVKSKKILKDKSWVQIKYAVEKGPLVKDFGNSINSIMGKYLSQYNEETRYADASTINDYKNQLTQNLSKVVEPSYLLLVKNMRKATLQNFEEEIVKKIKERGSEFEAINSEKFFTDFKDLLEDAHIQLASWNEDHTSSQLEEMKSKLGAYEEGARIVVDSLTNMKKNEKVMWTNAINAGVSSAAFGAAILAAPLAAPLAGAAGSLGAVTIAGLGFSIPIPAASLVTFAAAFVKNIEEKKKMKKNRSKNKAVGNIMNRVESP